MNRSRSIVCIAFALVSALTACQQAVLSGPPELRLGRSECGECGMLISEDRCSSALLIDARGRREHVLYDDIGCMLDAERRGLDGAVVAERYVHDYGTRAWVEASAAHFVAADRDSLQTPMGSGLVAFASAGDAEASSRTHKGRVLDYTALAAYRRAWMEERFGKPGGGE